MSNSVRVGKSTRWGRWPGWSSFPDGHDEDFLYDGITIDYIGTPGPRTRSDLVGINDLGEAAGKSGTVHENVAALLRRTNGSTCRLGTLGGGRSAAKSINSSSQVVGWSKLVGDPESRPFLWEDGVMDPCRSSAVGRASANGSTMRVRSSAGAIPSGCRCST